jgi:hypothetical protein
MTNFPRFRSAVSVSQYLPAETASPNVGRSLLGRRIASIWRGIADFIDTMADYYAAAAIYEQLSRLSEAELRRRGLSRDTLARDVCAACDRMARP